MVKRQGVWREAGPKQIVMTVTGKQMSPQSAQVVAESKLRAGDSFLKTVYTFYGNGRIVIEGNLAADPKMPDLPRIGMQMAIPGAFRYVTWYGRGPQENYLDRNTGAAIGIYSAPVDTLWFPYIEPQETGNRTDVRWITLLDNTGSGLKASGLPTLYFSAWPFKMEELEKHKHPNELKKSADITVNLDYRQMGVGGDDSWGALPHDEFMLHPGRYSWKFSLEPVE